MAIFLYDLVPPFVVGKIVDFFTYYESGQPLSSFYFYVLFISISWILASLIRLKSKNVLGILRQHARARARIWGFERLTEFSLEWHNKENTGNKLQRIFTGGEAVGGWIKIAQRELAKIFINSVGVLAYFIFTDIKFGILIIVYTFLFFTLSYAFGKKIYTLS